MSSYICVGMYCMIDLLPVYTVALYESIRWVLIYCLVGLAMHMS